MLFLMRKWNVEFSISFATTSECEGFAMMAKNENGHLKMKRRKAMLKLRPQQKSRQANHFPNAFRGGMLPISYNPREDLAFDAYFYKAGSHQFQWAHIIKIDCHLPRLAASLASAPGPEAQYAAYAIFSALFIWNICTPAWNCWRIMREDAASTCSYVSSAENYQ